MSLIMENLEGEVAEWVTALHDEGAPELGDPDMFLGELRTCFGNIMQTRRAENDVHNVKQGGPSVAEYIREFQKIAGRLRHWSEQLLTHYFRDGLNQELFYMCLPRGIPNQLHDWYQLVTKMELDLREYKGCWRPKAHPKKSQERLTLGRRAPTMPPPIPDEIPRCVPGLCF